MSAPLPTENDAATALLAQAIAGGRYLRTPADKECPSGTWILIPLDRRLVRILELAGQALADLEDAERELDRSDDEHSDPASDATMFDWTPDWRPWTIPSSETDVSPT